jgi:ABC-type glycerol-3-phosphate transport system permease component
VRRLVVLALALGIGAPNLLLVWLLAKQAITPERESFAWPPSPWPVEPTLANFRAAAAAVDLGGGLALSAGVALASAAIALAIAGPAAWLAARRPALDRPLDTALVLARVFPTVALAIPLAALFVRAGLYNHPAAAGLVLAHVLLGLPFAFLVLRAGFAGVPRDLEDAARLDGASPAWVFARITLPLARPSLAAAALLVFLLSWDEFAFSLLIQVTERPLPPLLYYLAAFGHPGLASAVAVLLLAPAVAIAALIEPTLRSGVLAGSGR